MTSQTKLEEHDFNSGFPIAELPENTPVLGHSGGDAVVLVRSGGEVCALAAVCSHYSGPLAEGLVVDGTLRCPWHHARFDLRTGEALGAPALDPIASYEVHRRGECVVIGPKKPRPKAKAPPLSPRAVIIVGAGAAGSAAAERLRHLGHTGSITLIGNEPPGPVDRPNLSKDYLAGTAPEEWVPLRTSEFYERIGVTLEIDDAAVTLDPDRKTLGLRSGRELGYDALLLATGAAPARLEVEGAEQAHVFTLRTLADSRSIIAAAEKAQRAVIIGSSFIGLETAASLRARGLEVDVVGRGEAPLERLLGKDLGLFIQRLHEAHGVRFHLSNSPQRINSNSVELQSGGTLPADLVVLGVGVQPRTELAEKAGLLVANGVVVDEHMRTSVPGIWAAGDVANYPSARLNKSARIEHWVVAQRQGQAVAHDMLGLGIPFRETPFFWSQHYDVTLAYVGHAESWDSIEVIGSLEKRDAAIIYRLAGRVLAVVTIGQDRRSLAIEAALERGDEAEIESLLHG